MITQLVPGTKLEVVREFFTVARLEYQPGDVLELIEPTMDSPHGYKSFLCNWVVRCKYQTSVWSSIWWALDKGIMKVVEVPPEPDIIIRPISKIAGEA